MSGSTTGSTLRFRLTIVRLCGFLEAYCEGNRRERMAGPIVLVSGFGWAVRRAPA